jgi:hypothetical protein
LASFQIIVKSKYFIIALIVSSAWFHGKSHFYFSCLSSLSVVFLFRLFPGIALATYRSPNILISTKDRWQIIAWNLAMHDVGQSFFLLSGQTTVIQDLLVRRQFSLVPDNRTDVNIEAWSNSSQQPSWLMDTILKGGHMKTIPT